MTQNKKLKELAAKLNEALAILSDNGVVVVPATVVEAAERADSAFGRFDAGDTFDAMVNLHIALTAHDAAGKGE